MRTSRVNLQNFLHASVVCFGCLIQRSHKCPKCRIANLDVFEDCAIQSPVTSMFYLPCFVMQAFMWQKSLLSRSHRIFFGHSLQPTHLLFSSWTGSKHAMVNLSYQAWVVVQSKLTIRIPYLCSSNSWDYSFAKPILRNISSIEWATFIVFGISEVVGNKLSKLNNHVWVLTIYFNTSKKEKKTDDN